ncbi:multidrug resistance protein [Weizmannia acidilactici]|uniref:MDR family MFS transporter n=1 Tax=Weizmannia acidilactici TaxID=2607726 RepID=UPI00124E4B9D|nr:MFS transporter [Weizmannia acidilactici]GER66726.1 multidrug resistance protein [Weizmannia acidilactici]
MKIRDWDQNLKVRLFGESLMNLTFWMFFPFLTIYFTEEFGTGLAGTLLIVSQVFSAIANLLGGYYADRFGRKKMMVLSSFGQGIAFLFFGFANSPWFDSALVAFICFSVSGVFGSLYYPASQAMIADVVDEKNRSHVFAVFYTSVNISVVVGPVIGGIFFAHYRFELLVFAALSCLVLGILLVRYTRETAPLFANGHPQKEKKWYSSLVEQAQSYQVIIKDKIFMLFIFAGILVAQTYMQLDLILPVYTKKAFDEADFFNLIHFTGEQLFGFILSENGLIVALFSVAATKWMARYRERDVFVLSSLLYAVSIYLFGVWISSFGFIFSMLLFSLGELVVTGIQQNFVSKLSPPDMRAQYFAAASLRYTLGRTIAPISIPLAGMIGYKGTFAVLAVLAVASAGMYIVMFRQYEKRRLSGT